MSEIYLTFLHSQAAIFEDAVRKIEKQILTAIEAYRILNHLKDCISNRLNSEYLPITVQHKLVEVEESNPGAINKFKKHDVEFYTTAQNYLNEWTESLDCLKILVLLKDFPSVTIDKNNFFDEIHRLNWFYTRARLKNKIMGGSLEQQRPLGRNS